MAEKPYLAGDGITIHSMPDMDKSQLDAAIRKEMLGEGQEGKNSETEASTETEETGDAQPEEKEEAKAESEPTEKRRSNVPKILRERNELRREVQELKKKLEGKSGSEDGSQDVSDIDARIAAALEAKLEEKSAQSFFESNPEAAAKKKAVEAMMDDHGLSASDAWTLYLAKNDPKALAKNATKALSTPSVPNFGNRRDKSFEQMSSKDQKSMLKQMAGKGEISF